MDPVKEPMSPASVNSPETSIASEHLCPLCGSTAVALEFNAAGADARPPLSFPILHCRDCAVSFTGSGGDNTLGENLYPETYYGKQSVVNRSAVSLFQWLRYRGVRRACPSGKRLLDVGAGDGRFVLGALGQGWAAFGCEPSTVGKEQSAKQGLMDQMFFGEMNDLPQAAGSFDLVTLWHSLEHVDSPPQILKSVHRLLCPHGRLLISVPNQAGLAVRWFQDRSFHLDVPRHRFHFSPESLARLLNRCGFRVLKISHYSFEYSPFGWWQTLLNVCGLERNSLYRWLKRGNPMTRKRGISKLFAVVATISLSVIILPLSFLLSAFEAVVRRGMIITVVAEKVSGDKDPR